MRPVLDQAVLAQAFLRIASIIIPLSLTLSVSVSLSRSLSLSLFAFFKPLKPVGYVMHHQFNIQQLYALPTLYLCVLYLSENKQRLVPLTA